MSDLSCIQALDAARTDIAAKTAAYEAQFGKVETLPIRIGDAPVEQFTIHNPEKPKPAKQSRALRNADHKRVLLRTTRKMEKVNRIRELAATGITIEQIAERAGFTPPLTAKYVMRQMLEHGIVRGTPAGRVA